MGAGGAEAAECSQVQEGAGEGTAAARPATPPLRRHTNSLSLPHTRPLLLPDMERLCVVRGM